MNSLDLLFRRLVTGVLFYITVIGSAYSNPNCFAEGTNNWERCPATCFAACRDTSIDLRGNRSICEKLARRDKANLKDDAGCAAIFAQRPDPPLLEACLTKSRAGPNLADLLKKIQTPSIREPLERLLENPPSVSKTSKFSCGPKPAALKSMYDCVRVEAGEIDVAVRSLQGTTPGDDKGQCGRSLDENEKGHNVLIGLQARAAALKNLLENGLQECNAEWTQWLNERSQARLRDDRPLPQAVANLIGELVKDISDELKQANATKDKADAIIKGVDTSLEKIQADIIKAMLKC
jgi:hypothetical protein